MFKLLHLIIVHQYIDKERPKKIVSDLCKYHLYFYQSLKHKDLESLAMSINCSRETLRLKKDDLKKNFTNKFSFIRDLEFINEINIDRSLDFISISEEQQVAINDNNGTDFSRKFIARIYSVLDASTHRCIGDEEKEDWKSSYLVTTKTNFDFVFVVNECRFKLRPYPIRKQIQNWTYENLGTGISNELDLQIVKGLIAAEFGEGLTDEIGIVLPKTKSPNLEDILLVIFQNLGAERAGHHIDTIISAMDEGDHQQYQETSVRRTLNHDPRFMCYGKTSTYILSDWLDISELGIIAGDYGRLCQRILETEPMPLDMDTLVERISHHRRNPIRRSITTILGNKKEIFQVKGSFVGLVENKEHVEILEVTGRVPAKYFSRDLWRKLKESGTDITRYFEQKGLTSQQISYLTKYMVILEPNAISNEETAQKPSKRLGENDINRLLELLAGLDVGEPDKYNQIEIRREHILLKQLLFQGRTEMECALCSRNFPTRLLSVAHIKRRAMASKQDRKNRFIVMAACYLGCDALYERGYISVGDNGKIIVLSKSRTSDDLSSYIDNLEHKECKIYSKENRRFFEDHYKFHISKMEKKRLFPNSKSS